MKINIIANAIRTERGEQLTIEMLRAELEETKSLVAKTTGQKEAKMKHIDALEAMINYKLKRLNKDG